MPTQQILVVAAPGQLQEGLQVLLATLPDAAVAVVANARAATQVTAQSPQLVIVAGGDVASTLAALGDEWPAARFLALVEHGQERERAQAAGADVALVQGAPAGRLLEAVRHLLAEASEHPKEA